LISQSKSMPKSKKTLGDMGVGTREWYEVSSSTYPRSRLLAPTDSRIPKVFRDSNSK
jgi:hypothetical protein